MSRFVRIDARQNYRVRAESRLTLPRGTRRKSEVSSNLEDTPKHDVALGERPFDKRAQSSLVNQDQLKQPDQQNPDIAALLKALEAAKAEETQRSKPNL